MELLHHIFQQLYISNNNKNIHVCQDTTATTTENNSQQTITTTLLSITTTQRPSFIKTTTVEPFIPLAIPGEWAGTEDGHDTSSLEEEDETNGRESLAQSAADRIGGSSSGLSASLVAAAAAVLLLPDLFELSKY